MTKMQRASKQRRKWQRKEELRRRRLAARVTERMIRPSLQGWPTPTLSSQRRIYELWETLNLNQTHDPTRP